MASSKTILILGGGVGGVATARSLRKLLPRTHRIVLVDRERDHVFAPSLLWLMVGQRTAAEITRPLARLARNGIDAARKRIRFANGAEVEFDLLAYVPPHRAPAVVRDSGLTGESGWMSVDRHTLRTRWPNVFAIGDVVSIPLALGKPLPKAGVFAHRQAAVVAETIAHDIAGHGQPGRFDGHGDCFIEVGGGKAGFGGGDFYAEPKPMVTLRPPGRWWHLGKVWVEKSWLYGKL